MEPVDPRLGGALGEGSGGPEELRAIVERASRRMRVRSAAVAGAVALVAGGGVGYAVSLTGSSGQKIVATAPLSGNGAQYPGSYGAAAGAGAASSAIASPAGVQYTPVFNRQANGVDIRGFLIGSSANLPAVPGTCVGIGPRFQAELSTEKMVAIAGSSYVPQQLGPNLLTEQPSLVGEAEGDPVAVVVLETNPSVAKVRMDFTGGKTDEMQPVKGWSVLAAPMPGLQSGTTGMTIGTLTVLDSSGRTLSSVPVSWPPALPAPLPMPPVTNGGSGSGTANSGTANSGTGSSATANSGTAISGTSGSGKAGSGVATYPCAVPPPTGPVTPNCSPPATTVPGEVWACPAQAPASEPTSTFPKSSGG